MNLYDVILMAPQGQSGGGGGMFSTLIMFGLIIVIFYFMILRPQQKRQKERDKMLNDVQKGDKIVTTGGVHGTVMGIEDKTLLVQIAENVKVKLERSAISSIVKSTSDNVGKTN